MKVSRIRVINFLLFFIVCFLLLGMSEVFLRVYTKPFVVKIRGNKIVLPREGRTHTYRHSVQTDKLDKLVVLRQNTLGYRGEEPPANFTDYLTIIAIGGSTTYNAFISDGKTWIDILGEKLKKSFTKLWINNAGFNGFTTEAHIIQMKDHITKLKPRMVIFLIGKNDSIPWWDIGIDEGFKAAADEREKENRAIAKKIRNEKKEKNNILIDKIKDFMRRVARNSELFSLALTVHRNIKAYQMNLPTRVMNLEEVKTLEISVKNRNIIRQRMRSGKAIDFLSAYEERLLKLIRLSRVSNIEPVFITTPALYGGGIDEVTGVNWARIQIQDKLILDGELWWEWREIINDSTRKISKKENILLIDLAQKLPKNSKFYIDLIHYSNEGNNKVANIIYEKLCPYISSKYEEYLTESCNSSLQEW